MSAHGLAVLDQPTLQADLNYMVPMSERPRTYTFDPPPGVPAFNAAYAAHRVAVRDIRALDEAPTLDREGFAFLVRPTALQDFDDEDAIRSRYYAEAAQIIAAATGADRVHIFDHTIRRRLTGTADRAAGQPRQPVPRVHVDHTERSGPQRVRDLLPDEAERLLQGRVQIINLWRPIRGPVRDMPLGVCDAGSTAPEDFVPSDLVYRNRIGETYQVTYNPAHRWFYVRDMQPDEALLIKCYDSLRDGRARFAPHAAFADPTATGNVPPRESIEIRSLVFHAA
jgi:hypothetical protein